MAEILIVDDEENLSYSLQLALKRAGHHCRVAEAIQLAIAAVGRQMPDLVLLDMQLPDGSGMDLLARFREMGLDVPVIVITAFGTVAGAVAAMKQGAVDYIQKPLSMEEVALAVDRCLEHRRIRNRLDAFQEAQRRQSGEIRLIGESPQMKAVLSLAQKIAAVPNDPQGGLVTTLVLGETGTGKEIVTRFIHHHGLRPDRPFVQLNCTAIPETLFEAELFGYEKGSFTDAKTTKKGLIEMAQEGTLFLDEIGDMPLATQAKLLVAIESGRFRRIGATAERLADVRVVAATNSDLQRKVDQGTFRADLFYRLKVFTIDLPPLRDRGGDLFLLTDYFLEQAGRKLHKSVPAILPETRELMSRYAWPGNVRELANVLQRAVLVNDGDTLEPGVLGIGAAAAASAATAVPPFAGLSFDFRSDDCTLDVVERRLIQAALQHTGGNVSETARILGLTRGGLRHRMDKLGLVETRPPKDNEA